MIIGPHPSHKTRFSDASTFDEICVNCGATDEVPGGWGLLAKPCPWPNGGRHEAMQRAFDARLKALRQAAVDGATALDAVRSGRERLKQ